MNEYVYIEIPGKPLPYKAHKDGKPRVFYGKEGCPKKIYSPKYNPRYKEKKAIEEIVRAQYPHAPMNGALIIKYLFRFAYPQNWTLSQKRQAKKGILNHTRKPDASNLVKFYEDCLKGIVITDDSLVVTFTPYKCYDEISMTQIWIRYFTPEEAEEYIKKIVYG